MHNRYTFPLVFLAVGAFLFVAVFTFSPAPLNNGNNNVAVNTSEILQEQEDPSYLFAHSASEGGFESIDGDKYILTLSDPDEQVIYFSDRPYREVGREKLGIFLDTLGFEIGDAPNAVITTEGKNGEKTMIVTELTEPIWNRDDNTLIYKATILKDQTGALAEYGEEVNIPESFASATFFIDSSKSHSEKDHHKEKECGKKDHKMTLDEAYEIAKGHHGGDTECLMHDGDFDKSDFVCSGDVWKAKINTDVAGEASRCQSYCIVLPEEKYKKGEGVARVEYECKHHSDEKGKKNIYCPKPKIKEDHHYKNAVNNIIDEYHNIADKAKDGHTSYEHHYCVTTGMPYSTKKHWATDCSGLGGYVLFKKLPYHYKLLDDSRGVYKKADRPLATDFYDFIHDLDKENKCWERIHKLENAKQGDFLV
ncbi:MAG: hypothetical protein U9Q12_04620, partial [Patescibacteria group bacterium]|nr:hypothetical protein [Patescibacteria group bacterium]